VCGLCEKLLSRVAAIDLLLDDDKEPFAAAPPFP
jgi:hypothetical protein